MNLKKFTSAVLLLAATSAVSHAQVVNNETETLEEKVARLENSQSQLQQEIDQKEYEANQKDVWSRRKSFTVGYAQPNLSCEGEKLSSNYGAFFSLSNIYLLHKKPLLNMIRIGLDATWMDINYFNHENGTGINIKDDFDDDEFYEGNLGIHQLEVGLGLGPSVNVAPFCTKTNKLKYLRASVYCHVKPTFSMIVMNGDDDSSLYGGVPIYVNYGVKISYRSIGIGIEGRSASTKYNCWTSDVEELEGEKVKFKSNSFRAYISLNF